MVISNTSVTTSRTSHPTVVNSDKNMWSSANTWSRQDRQPVEVFRAFVVLDRGDRRLEPRDVRFEGDADAVAEAPLHAPEHDAQVPRENRGYGESAGSPPHH